MKISVFGMGYVGAVSSACLARDGHQVIGVDPNVTKVDLVNRGITPIIEKDVGELIEQAVKAGRLRATSNVDEAVHSSDVSIICVGTPSQLNGNLDLSHVRRVCEQIGQSLRTKSGYHAVVARSTMLPGSTRSMVIPMLEANSGKRAGHDFGVCSNPEFLREGTAVYDYYHPPKTVIGEMDTATGDLVASLYREIAAELIRTDIESAELVKYVDNAWHALKVAFANEVGTIGKALGIDSRRVMEIFCRDTKLNLSAYYLRPGFAFGGSCLPKDVRALVYKSRALDLDLPLLNAILPSNRSHIQNGIRMIVEKGLRKVGFLGFSFKAGTDDLRESPLVEVVEYLIGKGYELKLYDRNVRMASLVGANKDYILNHIPHISGLMVDSMDEVLEFGEVLVIGNAADEFKDVVRRARPEQAIVDLVGITNEAVGERYDGICW